MSFRNLAIAAIAIASLSACSSNNDAPRIDAPNARTEGSGEVAPYQVGTPVYTFSAEEGQLMIDNANVDSIDDAVLEGYPTLLSHVKAVGSVTKAIETNENTLELYSGDELLMAFDIRGDKEALLWSKDAAFKADDVVYTRTEEASDQNQAPMSMGDVVFNFNECKVAEEEKQEEKQQDQDKVEEKQQEQGKLASFMGGTEEQGQEKDPGKVDEKGQPAPECKAVMIKVNLRQIVEEKKEEKQQDQGKVDEQNKEQDQGKVDDQEKQQDQGKVEDQEKQQDQGKVEDQEKQRDQGKVDEQNQERGQTQG